MNDKKYYRFYKLYDKENPGKFYIGRTTETLKNRIMKHRYECNNNNSKIYKYFSNKINNMEIELLEQPILLTLKES